MGEALATARLLLPPWSAADARMLARLAGDPMVVRYIGDGRPWSAEEVTRVARGAVEHWRAHGFGWRVAIDREAHAAVGFAALNYLGEGTAGLDPDEYEIGWWLFPSAWRRGFAGEAARVTCREAFARLRAPSVVARVQPGNAASLRVAARIGMSHEFDTTGRLGERVAVYRLAAADWRGEPTTGVSN